MKIVGIYLAAGKSTRMGRNKLELPFKNSYLGAAAFQSALESKLEIIFAITRNGDPLHFLAPFTKRNGWSYFRCENSSLSASLTKGVSKAIEWGADAVVVLLADQPNVTTTCINRLVEEYLSFPESLFVSASHRGTLKPPVLFAKALFPALLSVKGDVGARSLLRGKWNEFGKNVEFEDNIFLDIDTLADYKLLEG
ncbi:MAG TPA: nucleotidyltransferase family protein [Bacillales bacterium]|nr:nucleotidyltransferase family protein [Bacillales bacterium]